MATAAELRPSATVAAPSAGSVRADDALVVSRRLFQEFDLSDDELRRASLGLEVAGGTDLERLRERAQRMPKAPWESITADRREYCVAAVLDFHFSAADREKMALRTGAALTLIGEVDLGRKILETSPTAAFGVEPRGFATWAKLVQLALYTVLIVLLAAQSALSGLYIFLVAGIVLVAVMVPAVWLMERSRWKLEREEREVPRYLEALLRIDRGASPREVFAPDGSLRAAGS